MKPLPLSRPAITGAEEGYLKQSLASGKLSGDGPFTKRVRALLETDLRAKSVLLTTSCTSALELAALLLRGDAREQPEAIIPSFTFVSTANAFLMHGFKLVFADVDPQDGNLDVESVRKCLTPRTRVIVPVHYAGVPGDIDGLLALARQHDVRVVEDAAQAVFTTTNGRQCGTLGDLGAFSFHDTKNFHCGEGGALIVNREDLRERAEIVREKGTNRAQFLLGHVDKYTWVDVGGSFLPADVLAALLLAQLEARHSITARRKLLFDAYLERLAPLEQRGLLRLPKHRAGVEPNFHLFFVVTRDFATRTALMSSLNQQGIGAAFHYPALHKTPMGRSLVEGELSLPGSELLADCLLRLPLFFDMGIDDVDRVVGAVNAFFA